MSMNQIKLLRDMDEVYNKQIKELPAGGYICPVCGKSYVRKVAAENHLSNKDCHKLQDVIKDTLTEMRSYAIYKDVVSQVNPNAKVGLSQFRKSKLYNGFGRFSLFCTLHEIFDPLCYVDWLNQIKGYENLPLLLKKGAEEPILREFRLFSQVMELMDSEKFYGSYKEDLLTDDGFFVRSIEKAKISLKWLARKEDFPFDERLASLPVDYQNRIESLIQELV